MESRDPGAGTLENPVGPQSFPGGRDRLASVDPIVLFGYTEGSSCEHFSPLAEVAERQTR